MNTPKELLESCIEQYNKLKKDEPILGQIYEVIDAINSKPFRDWDINELSRMAGEISVLMVNLGQLVSDTTLEADASYVYRKAKESVYFTQFRKELDTIAEVNNKVETEILAEKEQQLKTEYNSNTLKALYRNLDRIVSVIQSRMKTYDVEKVQTGLHNEVVNI
jgi:hypothetical protein